jgi:integrase
MKIIRYLSDTNLEKLLLYIQEKADLARRRGSKRAVVDEVIVLLFLNTGLRPSELCNMDINDLIVDHGSYSILVRLSSGNVHRAVDVTEDIAEHIQRFVRLYRRNAKPSDPLLVSERGTRLSYMSLYNKVKRIGKSAKIGNLHPGVLRATYLVRLYNSRQDLWFVQKQAGHKSPTTTAMYAMAGSNTNSQVILQDKADSKTMEKTHISNKKVATQKHAVEKVRKQTKRFLVKCIQKVEKCEACGKSVGYKGGTKIDSGQVLCARCIEELRKLSPLENRLINFED